jgi:transposase
MDFIQGSSREQIILFPESIDDYITQDNPVQFIDAFVNSLELNALGFKSLPTTGRPPYDPGDLLRLYLYGYVNSVRSSRRLEKECQRNLEVLWLLKKLAPDFKTIADFRRENTGALQQVCRQFTWICKDQDLFGGELVAIDGSKFKAANANYKNISPRRLNKYLHDVDEKINQYFKDLDFYDEQESSTHKTVSVNELKKKINNLKKLRRRFEAQQRDLDKSPDGQISLTDPDARSMYYDGRTDVAYNCQTAVDEKHHLIVDHEVVNHPTDQNELYAMAKKAKETLGQDSLTVVADMGYYHGEEIKKCEEDQIDVYTAKPETSANQKLGLFHKDLFAYDPKKDTYQCPAKHTLKYRATYNESGRLTRYYVTPACRGCPLKPKCTRGVERKISRWEYEDVLDRMRERMRENPEMMLKRKCIVEHPFGTMKRWMNQGFFLMRGLPKVRAEFSLTVFAYNLKRAIKVLGTQRLVAAVS